MDTSDMTGSLMLLRIGGVLLIAIVAFLWFMRKRSNRHPMEHQVERNYQEIQEGKPPEYKP